MTFCFIFSDNQISLAAADTRLTLTSNGVQVPIDGSPGKDLSITVGDTGRTFTIPYHYRKIRQVGHGWAATAGAHDPASRILTLLKEKNITSFESIVSYLRDNATELIEIIAKETQLDVDELYTTRMLIGHPGSMARALQLDPTEGCVDIAQDSFIANWPTSVPKSEMVAAEDAFLLAIRSTDRIAGIVRAAAALIAVARNAPDCSDRAQIGLTSLGIDSFPRSYYFDGAVDEFKAMTDDEIEMRAKRAE